MPIIAFVLVTIIGISATGLALHSLKKDKFVSHHRLALTLTVGLGLTWAVAFFVPLAIAQHTLLLDWHLVLFGVGHSLFITLLIYIVARILYKIKIYSRK